MTALNSRLCKAAEEGDLKRVRSCLERGANTIDQVDNSGATPLLHASHNGHQSIVELLLNSGANIDQAANNNGVTPLNCASYEGQPTKASLSSC
jgi:ankyrin repeat protein